MPRGPRFDAPGTLHHPILRGVERYKIVKDEKDRDNFVARIDQVALKAETSISIRFGPKW
jgi:hypothetical protein